MPKAHSPLLALPCCPALMQSGLIAILCSCVLVGPRGRAEAAEAYQQDLSRTFILYADTAETAGMAVLKKPAAGVKHAVRVVVHRKTGRETGVELKGSNKQRIQSGDELEFTCLVRAVPPLDKSKSAEGSIVLHPNNPAAAVARQAFIARNKWVPISLKLTADKDYAKDQFIVSVFSGRKSQSLEIGDARLINSGPAPAAPTTKAVKAKLQPRAAVKPVTKPKVQPQVVAKKTETIPVKTTRDPPPPVLPGTSSGWLKEARARIEDLRTEAFQVEVVDAQGKPVKGATVSLALKKHAFAFGVAVNKRYLASQESRDQRNYGEVIKSLFNEVVMENGLKWNQWDSSAAPFLKQDTLAAYDWLREHRIPMRGHVLVWPGWNKQNPAGLDKLPAQELRQRINSHIADIVGHFQGSIHQWDVVNELRTNRDFTGVLGEQAVAEWFRTANQTDPKAKLFYNEFGVLNGPERNLVALENSIASLLEQKAPVHGIGLQGHFNQYLPSPEQMLARLDRLARLNLELRISEFDVDIQDEAIQAAFTRDFYTLAFSHPAVTGITTWGLWEGQHWRPQAALFRKNWEAKPNGRVVMDLIMNQWNTKIEAKTDRKGKLAGRGYLGTYELVARKKGLEASGTWTLGKNAKPVRIVLKDMAPEAVQKPVPAPPVVKPPVKPVTPAPVSPKKPATVKKPVRVKAAPRPVPVEKKPVKKPVKEPASLPVRAPVKPPAEPAAQPEKPVVDPPAKPPLTEPPSAPSRRYRIREVAPPPKLGPAADSTLSTSPGQTIKVDAKAK